jgi:hypothetical protein
LAVHVTWDAQNNLSDRRAATVVSWLCPRFDGRWFLELEAFG